MSIHSPQTGLGHLSLVIIKEKYLKASNNIKFVAQTDPEDDTEESTTLGITTRSMFESISSSNDPTSDTLQTIKAFEYNKQTYLKYIATITALRNLILWSSYDTVDDADHAADEDNMKKPWNPPEPIATN